MITARRLKRNFKRFLIPFETVLYWVAGPMALALYLLGHGALHGARFATVLFGSLRF